MKVFSELKKTAYYLISHSSKEGKEKRSKEVFENGKISQKATVLGLFSESKKSNKSVEKNRFFRLSGKSILFPALLYCTYLISGIALFVCLNGP